MRKRVLRGAAYIILALSIPALSWSLKEDSTTISQVNTTDSVTITAPLTAADLFENYVTEIYTAAGLDSASLDRAVFRKALTGYYNFRENNQISDTKHVLSIVDFDKPSTEKRLWIVDLESRKLLFNTFVSHGRGSGDNIATSFSNTTNSHQSSLGFYITDQTYHGKHGLSLRLNGMDKGYNTNAMSRAIVLHGANYVSQEFVNQHGRLGRSHGCPAVPVELTPSIIEVVKGKTTLFINAPSNVEYASAYLNEEPALNHFGNETLLAVK